MNDTDKLTENPHRAGAVSSATDPKLDDREWQERAMPWMLSLTIFLTLVFVAASLGGVAMVRADFHAESANHIDSALIYLRSVADNSPQEDKVETAALLTFASLDARLMELRHHRTSSVILASIWTRFMGYLTGMILALLGAIFVLGKLKDETPIQASGGGAGFSGSLTTAWPGLVLVVLGTILMVSSARIRTSGTQQEAPIYTQLWQHRANVQVSAGQDTTPPTPELNGLP